MKDKPTNEKGFYQISAPISDEYTVNISSVTYKTISFKINPKPGDKLVYNKTIFIDPTELNDVTVTGRHDMIGNIQKIEMKDIQIIPTTGSGIESILKTLPGVSSNNEMTQSV